MKRKMKTVCIGCMHSPCQCLPKEKDTALYIYQSGFLTSKKAFSIVLAKQTLDNGVPIKAGTRLWIPGTGGDSHFTQGGKMCKVPNWKLNELVRSYNLAQIRQS